MARLTVSLSDELKAQIDAAAQAQNTSVSELVQRALKSFFTVPQTLPNPTPAVPQPPPLDQAVSERLDRLEKYVASMAYETESLRQGVGTVSAYFQHHLNLAIPCPPPFEPPSWKHTPPPWMHFKFK